MSSTSNPWSLHSLSPNSVEFSPSSTPSHLTDLSNAPISSINLVRRLFSSPIAQDPLTRSTLKENLKPSLFDSLQDFPTNRPLWFPGINSSEFLSMWEIGNSYKSSTLARMRNDERTRLMNEMSNDLSLSIQNEKRNDEFNNSGNNKKNIEFPLILFSPLEEKYQNEQKQQQIMMERNISVDEATKLLLLFIRRLPALSRPLLKSGKVEHFLSEILPGPIETILDYLIGKMEKLSESKLISKDVFLSVWNEFVTGLFTNANWREFIEPKPVTRVPETSEDGNGNGSEAEEVSIESTLPQFPELTALCSIM